jgi:hypothetical protein
MRCFLVATLICAAGLLALAGVTKSAPRAAVSCPPHQHGTTGDYEVVFGWFFGSDMTRAEALRAKAHRKGFGCARFEHENGGIEVCVNGIRRYSDARRILRHAHRVHLRARLEAS